MDTTKIDDPKIVPNKSRNWRFGAVLSFVLPFILAGVWAEYYSWSSGAEDIARWSHLVDTKPVAMSEQIVPILLWFVLPGLLAGAVGLLLFYLFTRSRSY